MDHHVRVHAMLEKIEAEMRKIGFWQSTPLEPAQYQFREAFAADTMSYGQWLQFVFIPRVRGIIDEHGEFPAQSMVGVQAMREFDGLQEADQLVHLLHAFDALIEGRG
jgi:uncharacterized protein YqcC (DUF446 family)